MKRLPVTLFVVSIFLLFLGVFLNFQWGVSEEVKLYEGEVAENFARDRVSFMIRCQDIVEKATTLAVIEEGEMKEVKTLSGQDRLRYRGVSLIPEAYGEDPFDFERLEAVVEFFRPEGSDTTLTLSQGQKVPLPGRAGAFLVLSDFRENFRVPGEDQVRDLGRAVELLLQDEGENSFWLFENFPEFDRNTREEKYWFVLKSVTAERRMKPFVVVRVRARPGMPFLGLGGVLLLISLLSYRVRRHD